MVLQIKKEIMRDVKIQIFMLAFLISCSSYKSDDTQIPKEAIGGDYKINRDKSISGYTNLAGAFYFKESPDQLVNAFATVNGVMIAVDSGKFNINVRQGSYEITGGFIGRKWVVCRQLKLEEGDSVFVNFYLEQDDRPLIHYNSQ